MPCSLFLPIKGGIYACIIIFSPMSAGLNAAEFVACMSPILFDTRYSPYQLASWTETGQYPSVNGNLLLLSSRFGSQTEELFFIVRDGRSAYELIQCRLGGHLRLFQPHYRGASLPPHTLKSV